MPSVRMKDANIIGLEELPPFMETVNVVTITYHVMAWYVLQTVNPQYATLVPVSVSQEEVGARMFRQCLLNGYYVVRFGM